ncbi:MAG: site-2 protease family protein [Oscillibacter sp.]|jgi:regulator of sigma E protease|nr:site-2 protease family protein [Oscillibacter sp.]
MTIVYILAAILIFGVLIAVHELGHFLAAKACGVQVNEFSIGMGPALWHHKKGETEYSLRALPIGGFCAMEGEEESSDSPRALSSQGFWKKFVIFAAGSFVNFLTGLLIVVILYSSAAGFYSTELTGFAPECTAQSDGLMTGDTIYSVDGERVYLFSDLDLLFGLNKTGSFDLVVLRDGEKVALDKISMPVQTCTSADGTSYSGRGLFFGKTVGGTVATRLQYSWLNTMDFARIVRLSLQMLVTGKATMNDVSGPVGIVSTITQVGKESETARDAVENILYFAALIAVNLSIMNMLPIPALDGGHIFFLIVDTIALALFKKKIPDKYEAALNMVFLVALMGFMAVVTFHDVFKLIQ